MKAQLIVATIATSFLFACGKKDEDKAKAKPAKPAAEAKKASAAKPDRTARRTPIAMETVPITYEDFKATMLAPKGAVFAESFGTLEVKVGDGKEFFVQIDTDAPDIAALKAEIEKNDVQKLIKFHKEGDTFLLYEDGVYAAVKGTAMEGKVKPAQGVKFYVLGPDMKARGIGAERLTDGIEIVDYAGFVDLATEHEKVVAWV